MEPRRLWIGRALRGLAAFPFLGISACEDGSPPKDEMYYQMRSIYYDQLSSRTTQLERQIRTELLWSKGQITAHIASLQAEWRHAEQQLKDFTW